MPHYYNTLSLHDALPTLANNANLICALSDLLGLPCIKDKNLKFFKKNDLSVLILNLTILILNLTILVLNLTILVLNLKWYCIIAQQVLTSFSITYTYEKFYLFMQTKK